MMKKTNITLTPAAFVAGVVLLAFAATATAQAVIPGWDTDPTAVKSATQGDAGYLPPEAFRYPYISTYYVKPTVTPDEAVKVGIYVTDFEHSKIRFLDDSHRFTAFLEYRPNGGESKVLTLEGLTSGDAEFNLGKLPVGDYELRVWARDAKGRESHRVIHDFRVISAADLAIPAAKVYMMTTADLTAYGIRNDGDLEKVVYVGADKAEVVKKEKRTGVPGYTVTVPLDAKTGKPPFRAFEKVTVTYDAGYDKAAVEATAVATAQGLQKLIDDKAAAGFRKVVLLPGTYRVSHAAPLLLPDRFTLDLGTATLKLNPFAGEKSVMLRMASALDAHLIGGTLEGDYWAHDYKNSPKDSEWVNGFMISGDSRYCSVEGVTVREITGYGGLNTIEGDGRGSLAFFCERMPRFAAGGLNPKTGEVDAADPFRFTTDFMDLGKITGKLGRRRLQISKYLGYQGVKTRSWQMTVCWYDANRVFLAPETAWQYREMWIPEGAAFLRVSIEEKSLADANPALYTEELQALAIRYPVNCAVRNCRFERCRCVGYAAAQMKNMLFEGNFFTESGEAEAKCAFDAEDGADQMQDVYFLRNTFRDNPVNNSILTCAGHNFILEKNNGGIHFWGRTHSPCVRDNDIEQATYYCDTRLRSGYARLEGNRYSKGIRLGINEWKDRPDNWDQVLSGETFDGAKEAFKIEVGKAGRLVGCTFRNMDHVGVANAFACVFENCKGWCPGVRWTACTVKNSRFSTFSSTSVWNRCHFWNTKIESINKGTLLVNDSDFTDVAVNSFSGSTVAMEKCAFVNSTFDGAWWSSPAKFSLKDCQIVTAEKTPFFSVGVYTIGDFRLDGCTVSGRQPLMHIRDLRPLQYFQGENPDGQPGVIVLKDVEWKGEATTVVTHGTGKNEPLSLKLIEIDGSGSVWPAGVKVATDPFPTWRIK